MNILLPRKNKQSLKFYLMEMHPLELASLMTKNQEKKMKELLNEWKIMSQPQYEKVGEGLKPSKADNRSKQW